jgi:hypothetical protein
MVRKYWKVAPGSNAYYWDECREANCIAINWLNGFDLRKFGTTEELKDGLITNGDSDRGAWQIWYFVREMEPGDVIVANEASGKAKGIGVVTSDYLPPSDRRNPFNSKKQEYNHHVRLVDWTIVQDAEFETLFFQRPTVVRLKPGQCERIKTTYLEKYPELKLKLDELFGPDGTSEPEPPRDEQELPLEAILKQFRQIILYGPQALARLVKLPVSHLLCSLARCRSRQSPQKKLRNRSTNSVMIAFNSSYFIRRMNTSNS